MFHYVEQDVNLVWQSCLENKKIYKYFKIREKIVLQPGWNGFNY